MAALVACNPGANKSDQASTGQSPPAKSEVSSRASAGPNWDDAAAGPSLFVVGSNPSEAVMVLPHYTDSTLGNAAGADAELSRGLTVDLFARDGLVGSALLTAASPGSYSGSCTSWPTAAVAPRTSPQSGATAGAGPPPSWAVAFVVGHAVSLPMDSVALLSPIDSARRAAELVRVASALRGDTAAAFRGLPFTVRDAHRFVLPDGTEGIAAELVRRINEEANPREQHILLIIERDTTPSVGGPPQYVASYVERASGPEDDLEASEVLAGVLLGPHRTPTIVVGRDDGDGGSYTLVTRVSRGRWVGTWNSAYTGC